MEFETRTNTEGVMVTVVCITYNHELYIKDALDSFVHQKTNFKYKVFVGEDCGPDGTAEIVKEYAEKYPDIIVPFLREENMGAQRNLIDLCQRAESPYIAICEGDDYWIDEYKLQKQFDYMEANPEIPVCYGRVEIEAPEDWFLRSWFKANSEGKLIFPDCEPSYKMKETPISCYDCVWVFPAHSATLFYRWNYAIEYPEWLFTGIIGDHPIFLMQLGEKKAGFLPDILAVYRRGNVGAYMSKNMDEHFLKTRIDHVRWMTGMLDWYKKNQKKYPKVEFENRIKAEAYNYLKTALKVDDYEAILKLFEYYPEGAKIALNAYLSFYQDGRALTNTIGWDGYKLIIHNKIYRNSLRPYVKLIKKIDKYKKKYKNYKNKIINKLKKNRYAIKCKNFLSLICYWRYSFVPKRKNLWVITSFRAKGYLDNSKYFYEYIVENHPEIDIYWLTKDNAVYEKLKKEKKPVCKFNTKECRKILSHAEIAITDHNIMCDYDNFSGFNNKIKVVNLWHGVGFKAMGDGKKVKTVSEPGVQYSYDILPQSGDDILTRIIKKIKYVRHAYYRELFEEYFMLVCPGQERVEMIGEVWNVPKEAIFMAGHPRNILAYSMQPDEDNPQILYAPTFRYDPKKEAELVDGCINAFDLIENVMEKINGTFVLRLHPHTWRDYKTKIKKHLPNYARIVLDEDKDLYTRLGTYNMVISDYSSTSLDIAMLGRPVVYYCPDYEWFITKQAGFNMNFEEMIPGPMTFTWEETLMNVEEYIRNPNKDAEYRKEKCRYFFDPAVNDENNSERIVQEIKRRLDMK